ncbi:MAG: TetR/AcrR family transcriptional regulator [Bradyrhizobium sp.]|nr:TetR/AcrR family transcriptional regulator [Bradyrhizobium sp.]
MARTRAQDYDVKRDTILRKAAELIAKHGYPGTSISMIAEACGMSKALLYHYYPDKEAVLFDIISTHLDELVEVVDLASGGAQAGERRLESVVTAVLEAYRDADAQHQVQLNNLKLLPEDKQEVLRTKERRLVALLAAAIAEVEPSTVEGPYLKPLTMSLFGMLNWHYLWFREGRGLSRHDYARLVTRLFIAGVKGAVEPLRAGAKAHASVRPKRAAKRSSPSAHLDGF